MANQWRRGAVVFGLLLAATASVSTQTIKYIDGVFVAPRGGAPIELIAYAEANSRGMLKMQHGTLDDAPLVHELVSVLVSVPHWQPRDALVTTTHAFSEEQAERRTLRIAINKLNVYALGVRIADLERRDKIASLLNSVRASYDNPGYAFIVIESEGGYQRFFPIRLTPLEK
jgi:hypothetical protein